MSELNYYYKVKNSLSKETDTIDCNETTFKMVMYRVNRNGKTPFLEFLLMNIGNVLNFPVLPLNEKMMQDNFEKYSKLYTYVVLSSSEEYETFDRLVTFDGFLNDMGVIYLFFDITNISTPIYDTFLNSRVRFVLVDEIINHNHICNIPIGGGTVQFFLRNTFVNYLHETEHDNSDVYEIPIVAFVSVKTEKQLNFVHMFGESPVYNDSSVYDLVDHVIAQTTFETNYCFTNIENALRAASWSKYNKPEYIHGSLITDNQYGRYTKGGIVRFALFMGKSHYMLVNDKSEKNKKEEGEEEDEIERMKEKMKDYDSCYIDRSVRKEGGSNDAQTFMPPLFVVKKYEQQLPLSIHYVNKQKLGEVPNETTEYQIM